MKARRAAAALFVAAAVCCAAHADALSAQVIRGLLRERDFGPAINLGRVVLVSEAGDSVASTLTTRTGFFALASPTPGNFYLVASALGYERTTAGVFELGAGGEMSVEFRISPAPLTIEQLVVELPHVVKEPALIANGFYDRLEQGLGRFITPADIEKRHALWMSDLFWGIPRLSVIQDGGRSRVVMRSTRGYCTPTLVLDGAIMGNVGGDLENMVPLSTVEAIEVYRGATELPLQYSGTMARGCGAIVIWTKSGGVRRGG